MPGVAPFWNIQGNRYKPWRRPCQDTPAEKEPWITDNKAVFKNQIFPGAGIVDNLWKSRQVSELTMAKWYIRIPWRLLSALTPAIDQEDIFC
jgi:hypothetical protein